jgi:antibiotic biosynthesis monooxygenase (ABM) superfamily enzyme
VCSGNITQSRKERNGVKTMISRVWFGWTTPANADTYEALLKGEVIPGILRKNIPGFRKIDVFRRAAGDEVEFMTVMAFDSIDAVRAFVGEDHEVAYVPPAARAVLKRFNDRAAHYELRESRVP